jgi:hypothetical protein
MSAVLEKRILFGLSVLLSFLIATASYIGAFMPEFYYKETANWQAQAIGQDVVNLFAAVPALFISAFIAFKGGIKARLVWSGSLLYIIYSYAIYCFAVHFNALFFVYCIIFGLSFYLLAYFIFMQAKAPMQITVKSKPGVKPAGIFLLVIAVLFYFLWLSDISTSIINNTVPQSITEAGAMSNPVHVLDLALLLPAFVMVGISALKMKPLGLILLPAMLVFCILMNLAIMAAVIAISAAGLSSDYSVVYIFILFTLISAGMLAATLRNYEIQE